jgi:hypothetical protein
MDRRLLHVEFEGGLFISILRNKATFFHKNWSSKPRTFFQKFTNFNPTTTTPVLGCVHVVVGVGVMSLREAYGWVEETGTHYVSLWALDRDQCRESEGAPRGGGNLKI